MSNTKLFSSPWIYPVYFLQGFPFALVTMVSEVLYQQHGLDNARITLLTALLGLPWMLKCFWGPAFENIGSKRSWIIAMQGVMALMTLILLLVIGASHYFIWCSFMVLMLLALASAMHDFNADGYYILRLSEYEQAYFVGWRSGAYQAGRFCAQGGMLILLGWLEHFYANSIAWRLTYTAAFVVFLVLFLCDWLILKPESRQQRNTTAPTMNYGAIMLDCLRQPGVVIAYLFVFFVVIGQVQLNKVLPLFMLDKAPGMGLSALDVGEIFGALGTVSIIIGTIVGGMLIARYSFKRYALPSLLLLAVTNLGFVAFSTHWLNSNMLFSAMMMVDQFSFGLALATQMTFMLQFVANTRFVSSAYALLAAVMVLAMVVGGATSGEIQSILGYSGFFMWTAVLSLPGMFLMYWALRYVDKQR